MAEEKIIYIKLDPTEYKKLVDGVVNTKTELTKLRAENKEMSKDYANNSKTIEENNAKIKNLTQSYNQQTKAIQLDNKEVKGAEGAYRKLELQFAVASLKAKDLGAELGKESKAFKDASEKAFKLGQELKDIDAATNQHQRNVGNYSESLGGLNNQYVNGLQGVKNYITANGGLAGSFKAGGQAVMGMGKQLLMLLANPIVATIAAIAGAVMLLVKAMKSNGSATEKMNQIMAPFKVILDGVFAVLGKVVDVILSGVLAAGKFVTAIMAVIPGLNGVAKATQEAITLEKERQRLVAAARKDIVDDAKDQLRVAELRKMIAQKDKFTTEERLKFAREADEIERRNAIGDAQRANDALKLFLNDMKVRGKTQKDLTQEERDELARLQAEKYNEQKQYYDRTKKLAGVTATLIAEIESEEAKKTEERIEQRKINAEKLTEKEKEEQEKRLEELRKYLAEQESILKGQVKIYEDALAPKDKTLLEKVTEGANAVLQANITASTALIKNEQETADKIAEIENQKRQKKIDMAYAGLDTLYSVNDAVGAIADGELARWAKVNNGKANYDVEYAKKKEKLEYQSAVRGKALAVMQAGISTAAAIIKSLADPGGVAGIALSVLSGITGAAQVAAILATPIPTSNESSSSNGSSTSKTTQVTGTFHSGKQSDGSAANSQLASDEIYAKLLKAETVLDPRSSSVFDSILSNMSAYGGAANITSNVGINSTNSLEVMTMAFKKAVADIPPNQLSLREWTNFQKRVDLLETNKQIQ